MRIDLKVPFSEKDKAHAAGARWDDARKTWYVENHPFIWRFMAWMPDHLKADKSATNRAIRAVVPKKKKKRRS